jgi:hypothetical protein
MFLESNSIRDAARRQSLAVPVSMLPLQEGGP